MKTRKTIEKDVRGSYIAHEGVKYRPQIVSAFPEGSNVLFALPHPSTDDSHARVRLGDVWETWEPQV
jgi:hypothetical protein